MKIFKICVYFEVDIKNKVNLFKKNLEPLIFIKKHKILSLVLLIALIIIICVNYFFANKTPIWEYAHITGQIFTNLSLGYITSFIFYILVIYLKSKKDQANIAKTVSRSIILILQE